jgi:DNA-binding transcriptional MerR regulator
MELLIPAHVDEMTGYRYYDIKQNARLDMIQYMKELGMELKEIKAILDREDVTQIESVLVTKQEAVQQKIEDLNIQKEAITRTIDSIERYRKSPKPGTLTLEYIPRRRIYAIHTGINFYEHDIDTYEMILKQLKNDLISNHLPEIYYCNAGTILKQENFEQQQFFSDTMFVFVDRHFPKPESVHTIEDGMYACIYADSFDQEKEYAQKLLEFCRKNQYQTAGDYLCEVLMEFDVFDRNQRSMFLRLQVPVTFTK